jgi:ring-1,2-phenylacetyl-CoA epoxidase subunit PaaE
LPDKYEEDKEVMSAHFHKLKIKEVRRETPECVSIAFDVPEELKEHFLYKQGQYLTIRTNINGEEIRRSYSVCSSPFDNELRIAVKKIDEGIFSGYANEQLKKGDEIEAMPPMGKFFTQLNEAHKKSYVAFAAGSGITPVLSIIKTTLYTEPNSQFTLVYGNRNRHSIIFKEDIEAIKNKFINRFRVIHILSREKMDAPINFGRIDGEKCKALFENIIDAAGTDEFFICGPEEMIFSVKRFLEERSVDRKKIHFELFTTPEIKKQTTNINKTNSSSDFKSKVTIKLDGTSFDFDLAFEGDSILNAALKLGADLPFACKGGVCCTCRAKLINGEVDMDANFSLEPEEIEQGFILTCQSHPRTEKVVVNFDIK